MRETDIEEKIQMSDWTEIILIGCIVVIGIFLFSYGLYLAVSTEDLVTRTATFLPTGQGFMMAIFWSSELVRKYKELK